MYKVLIAEDEPIIRKGIINTIGWESLGFEICGVAEDGLEALEMVRRLEPDVLITDIKMPGMSGLELLCAINAEGRDIMTVILTGYADFEYARSALQERAYGYILKIDVVRELPLLMEKLHTEMEAVHMLSAEEQLRQMYGETVATGQLILDSIKGEPIEQAVAYVLVHFAEQLRMEDVAKRFYLHPAYFSRAFKQKTGEGFSQMVIRLRMEWACSILKKTNMRVSDIARAAGYKDLKHFVNQFRKAYGKTPSEYRKC